MNYMVSSYNNTLFTTAAAVFSAPAVVVAPTEKAAKAVQRLTKIWCCAKKTLSGRRYSAAAHSLKACTSVFCKLSYGLVKYSFTV